MQGNKRLYLTCMHIYIVSEKITDSVYDGEKMENGNQI